jgi:hypothetical protein
LLGTIDKACKKSEKKPGKVAKLSNISGKEAISAHEQQDIRFSLGSAL